MLHHAIMDKGPLGTSSFCTLLVNAGEDWNCFKKTPKKHGYLGRCLQLHIVNKTVSQPQS